MSSDASADLPLYVFPKPVPETYYYGIPGKSVTAWPDIPSHIKRLQWKSWANVEEETENLAKPLHKRKPPAPIKYQYFEFDSALDLSEEPLEDTVTPDVLHYEPSPDIIFKYFFKGTKKEVAIRQVFFHQPLNAKEENWLKLIRDYCRWKNFPIRSCVEPLLLRICYFNWRKFGAQGMVSMAYEHLMEVVTWRAELFPISDREDELLEDLKRGIFYWCARDKHMRPLLVLRLNRMPKNIPPRRFTRLTMFCFEWATRHLFIPGRIETCTVLCDGRGVPLHQIPMSVLNEMTTTLTRQYPFRLDRMVIINDSLFIQTVWAIAKQFLTEVQQSKMTFIRYDFKKELLNTFSAHQLEKDYGGTHENFTFFYPFPMQPGPYGPGEAGPSSTLAHEPKRCHEAIDEQTSRGVLWEGDSQVPIRWSAKAVDVFRRIGVDPPPHLLRTKESAVSVTDKNSIFPKKSASGLAVPTTAAPIGVISGGGDAAIPDSETETTGPSFVVSVKSEDDIPFHKGIVVRLVCIFIGLGVAAAPTSSPSSRTQKGLELVDWNSTHSTFVFEDTSPTAVSSGVERQQPGVVVAKSTNLIECALDKDSDISLPPTATAAATTTTIIIGGKGGESRADMDMKSTTTFSTQQKLSPPLLVMKSNTEDTIKSTKENGTIKLEGYSSTKGGRGKDHSPFIRIKSGGFWNRVFHCCPNKRSFEEEVRVTMT